MSNTMSGRLPPPASGFQFSRTLRSTTCKYHVNGKSDCAVTFGAPRIGPGAGAGGDGTARVGEGGATGAEGVGRGGVALGDGGIVGTGRLATAGGIGGSCLSPVFGSAGSPGSGGEPRPRGVASGRVGVLDRGRSGGPDALAVEGLGAGSAGISRGPGRAPSGSAGAGRGASAGAGFPGSSIGFEGAAGAGLLDLRGSSTGRDGAAARGGSGAGLTFGGSSFATGRSGARGGVGAGDAGRVAGRLACGAGGTRFTTYTLGADGRKTTVPASMIASSDACAMTESTRLPKGTTVRCIAGPTNAREWIVSTAAVMAPVLLSPLYHRSRVGSVTMPSFSMPARRTRSIVSTTVPYGNPASAFRYSVLSLRSLKASRSTPSRAAVPT